MELRILDEGVMDRSARRAPGWRAVLVVCALRAAAGLPGTPAHAQSDAFIWEDDDQSVVLVPQDDEAAPPNDHPATVAAPDIERMLASLRFRYADHENHTPPVPVFNAEQVEILGEALATGLGRATPSQDVRFSIIGAHRLSPDAFVRRNRLTAGRVFFRAGRLNVIFGELQSPYRKKNIYGRLDQDFYTREFGSRTEPGEQESMLVEGTAYGLRADTDGRRYDWVVFQPGSAANGSSPADASSLEETAPAAAHHESRPTPPTAGPPDSEQRLRTLKRLREKGLISEEAYRKKVSDILEEL
jgi:hypothetical protein